MEANEAADGTGTADGLAGLELAFSLCPRCFRATPTSSGERYCPNDGAKLLAGCPRCSATIASPYARFCVSCGLDFAAQHDPAHPPHAAPQAPFHEEE